MTTNQPVTGARVVELTDSPTNIRTVVKNYADDVDHLMVPKFASTAARDAAIPSPIEGELCYVSASGSGGHCLQEYRGQWRAMGEMGTFVIKTADESVSSSTTFQADNHLIGAVESNTTYVFEFSLRYTTNNVANMKVRLTYPTGATVSMPVIIRAQGGTTDTNDGGGSPYWPAQSGPPDATSPTEDTYFGGLNDLSSATFPIGGLIKGYIQVGATSGSLSIEWAQNASTAPATSILQGSFLELRRVV